MPSRKKPEGQPGPFVLPAAIPKLSLINGSVLVYGPGWDSEAREINAVLRFEALNPEFQLEAARFIFRQEGINRIDTGISTQLRYADEELIVESLDFGKKEISVTGSVALSRFTEEYIDFASELVFAESRINVSGTLDNRLLKVHTGTDSFDIGEIQRRLGGTGWDIAGNLKGETDITYNLATKTDLAGSFSLALSNGQAHGTHIESASLAGKFDAQSLYVSTAELSMPGNHFEKCFKL